MKQAGAGAIAAPNGWFRWVAAIGGRYSIATIGRLSISAAHFLASRFRALARAPVVTSFVTIISAFVLLIAFGPVTSLGGVLLGEIVLAYRFAMHKRAWKSGL